MKTIHQKLLRDLWRMKEQAIAVSLVMACGIATFVMALSMLDSLHAASQAYYERNRFADVFAHARRAPESLTQRFATIAGVSSVDTRIVDRVLLDVPSMREPASAAIVSLPERGRGGLNEVHLLEGRMPEGERGREVIVNSRFATAHGLRPGSTIRAIMGGRSQMLRIVGVGISPEFVFLIPPGGILPEYDRYAVFWMGRTEMEAAFDMDGAFNDVTFLLTATADERAVIASVDQMLAPFGGTGAYGRSDQPSHQILENEFEELRGTALIAPLIFLAVSAFLLNLILGRLMALQREQIAALRALGYTAWEIARHYLGFALAIAIMSAALGLLGGALMGRGLTAMYAAFFDFPSFAYVLSPSLAALGVAVGLASGMVAVLLTLRRVMLIPPAEALKPPAPMSYHRMIGERLGITTILPTSLRMVLRYLERRPIKTVLSTLGVAMATAILVVGRFTEDAMDYVMRFQFERVQQRDLDIVLAADTDADAVRAIRALPGVRAVEPYRAVAVRLRNGPYERRTGIVGLSRRDGMHHLLDMDGRPVPLPDRGIVVSSQLARALDIVPGERVRAEVLHGRRPVLEPIVAATVDDFSGLAVYASIEELNRQLREPSVVDGVYARVDPNQLDAFYARVEQTPRIVAVGSTAATRQAFEDILDQNLGMMRTFLIGFSVVIAIGVVYNAARTSLSERSRDLATLRVLGFTKAEVVWLQIGELAIVTLAGVPVGLVLGYALARLTAWASASELFRMPFVVEPATFSISAIVVLLASMVTALTIARRVRRLDLLAALKARE
ncbi:MAG: FtsX-like permease family protein [Phycisphaerales bacterium]